MTLLVLVGILSREILESVRKNTGVSIYLHDSNFFYGTLATAYKHAKEKSSFSHIRRLLSGMDGWDETAAKQAFLRSKDFTNFTRLLPTKMYALLLREDWMDPILQSLHETAEKSYVVSSPNERLALRLQSYPVRSLAYGYVPVGKKNVFVTAGPSIGHLDRVCGANRIFVGPGARPEELAAFRDILELGAPVDVAVPPVVVAEDIMTADGGCRKLYL